MLEKMSGLIWVQTVRKSNQQATLVNKELTLYSIVTRLKYHVFENIMENGACALLEQMLHFP